MSIRSGDILDQNLKLSPIEQNFGRVLRSQIFGVQAPKICIQIFIPASQDITRRSLARLFQLAPKLLVKMHIILVQFSNFHCCKIVGDTCPDIMCVSKLWSFSSMCKNLRGQHPLKAEIWSSEKVDFQWVIMRAYNFFVNGPKFAIFFVQRRRGCSWSLAYSMFNIRDQNRSCPKSHRVVRPQNVKGACPKKTCNQMFIPASHDRITSRGQVWWGYSHWPQSYWPWCAKFWANFWIFAFPHFWAPIFLDLTFNVAHASHHFAKFRGNRPRELGDIAPQSARKKHQQWNIKAVPAELKLAGRP